MRDSGRMRVEGVSFLPIRAATAALLLISGAVLGALLFAYTSGAARPADLVEARRFEPAAPSAGAPSGATGVATAGYASIARAVMPAVVNISSLQVVQTYENYSPLFADPFFRQFFGDDFREFVVPRERRALSLGSGVVVDDKGTILTNYHVVQHAREVKISLPDGRDLAARPLGADQRTDLAVLRVSDVSLPKAVLGRSEEMQVGDIVLAIGNPFGIGQTVTMGIVSAIGRGSLGLADYEDFIQTDAAINPGNSGGALVNTRGEVIGINTAILSRSGGYQGIGFAIPSSMARDILDSILKNGRVVRGYIGIHVQPLTPEIARAFGRSDTRGALVASVDPDGPAAEAGLRRGDLVVSLRGRAVLSDDDLRTQLSLLKPGERVSLEVERDGRRRDLDVVLTEPPEPAGRS